MELEQSTPWIKKGVFEGLCGLLSSTLNTWRGLKDISAETLIIATEMKTVVYIYVEVNGTTIVATCRRSGSCRRNLWNPSNTSSSTTYTYTHTHWKKIITFIFIPIYIYIYTFCCKSKERINYFKIGRSTKRFAFSRTYLFCPYIRVCFQIFAFRKHIWQKTLVMGYSMRFELVLVVWMIFTRV